MLEQFVEVEGEVYRTCLEGTKGLCIGCAVEYKPQCDHLPDLLVAELDLIGLEGTSEDYLSGRLSICEELNIIFQKVDPLYVDLLKVKEAEDANI